MALTGALLLHALVLLLPLTRPALPPPDGGETIEVELVAFLSDPPPVADQVTEPVQKPQPIPESESLAQSSNELTPPQPTPVPDEVVQDPVPALVQRETGNQKDIILSRQFITEEPVIDKLFGKPVVEQAPPRKGFHLPARPNMLAMLDRPMQDLPFEYTPGLVHFAYAPGVKGDLQRFWDIITPEFGWRTDNGTEFRCVWLLVIAGCGWK